MIDYPCHYCKMSFVLAHDRDEHLREHGDMAGMAPMYALIRLDETKEEQVEVRRSHDVAYLLAARDWFQNCVTSRHRYAVTFADPAQAAAVDDAALLAQINSLTGADVAGFAQAGL